MAGRELSPLQREKLGALLAAIRGSNAFYSRRLDGVAFDARRDPIDALPFTTRAEIERDQAEHPPYGSNLTFERGRYCRMHQTSGSGGVPLRWLDTAESWSWWKGCWSTIYDAAGASRADVIAYPFSFGPFVGFWSAFESACDRGNLCLAAGGMTTAARLRYVLDNRAAVICCTPTYALHMAECAAAEGVDIAGSAVRALIVAGEPGGSIAETRGAIEHAWAARVFDHAGMTEIGAWGFETVDEPGGLFVNEREFIAECINPQSLAPVGDGEVGELVLTNLGRLGSPLIRYRTGDLVRMTTKPAPQAIQNPESNIQNAKWCAGGVLGRADDMLVIRGNNVFPAAIEGVLRSVPGVAEFRFSVRRDGALTSLTIHIERSHAADAARLADAVRGAIRDRLHFRPDVEVLEPGALPRFEMKARRIEKK